MADRETETEQVRAPVENNEYTITQHSYPVDLDSDQFGHFIHFIIYETATRDTQVDGGTRNIQNPETAAGNTFQVTAQPQRERGNSTAINSRRLIGSTDRTVRTTNTISLYMPENVTTTYGLDYENVNMEQAVLAAAAHGTTIDQLNSFDPGAVSKIASKVGNAWKTLNVGDLASNPGSLIAGDVSRVAAGNLNDTIKNLTELNMREARNPHMEYLFRGVQQRQFSFEFNFTPKSEEEAFRVREIIKLFKRHALPKVRDNAAGVFYEYPAEFDIVFLSNGQRNNFLHKISTCALVSIDVNYTGQSVNSMHRSVSASQEGSGAPPTHTRLVLNFMELELMSQQRIDQGF